MELAVSTPSLRLLGKVKTPAQREQWEFDRYLQTCTAIYWLGMQECEGDLLAPSLEAGIISQKFYNLVVGQYDIYLHLWIVCVRAEKFIKEECHRTGIPYPFNSPYELFVQTVQEQGDYAFSLCLTPYREYSAQKTEKGIRLFIKHLQGEALTEAEEKIITRLIPATGQEMVWTHFLLSTAEKKAGQRKNPHLKRALDHYYKACADVGKPMATLVRKIGSFAITKDGLRKGSRYGGKYEQNS
jgi:hypothetical protein